MNIRKLDKILNIKTLIISSFILIFSIVPGFNVLLAKEIELGAPLQFSFSEIDELIQPDSPVNNLRSFSTTGGFTVNTANRNESADFFMKYYLVSDENPDVKINWTGNYKLCNEGLTNAEFRDSVLRRVNYFRAMAGIPADVNLDATFNNKAQKAALMMSVNNALSHAPPLTWKCFSIDGAEAAANSNLVLGKAGRDGIHLFMKDSGANNYFAGHRRWVLFPQTKLMGTGDVPGDKSLFPAQALWVLDLDNIRTSRPVTRDEFVAWPPQGFVPYQTVFARWSFSFPDADFSDSTVFMLSDGKRISVDIAKTEVGFGENSIVWIPSKMNDENDWPKPGSDTTYSVTVDGVKVNGEVRKFTYNVTIFDPFSADTTGKSFTFNCAKDLRNSFAGLEKMMLKLGGNETCTIKLTQIEPGTHVEILSNLRTGFKSSIQVDPVDGVTNENGELEIVISAIGRGVDWVSWAVPSLKGEFEFDKKAYDTGRAWGMFVEVQ